MGSNFKNSSHSIGLSGDEHFAPIDGTSQAESANVQAEQSHV
jgi:hypothetical protein